MVSQNPDFKQRIKNLAGGLESHDFHNPQLQLV